MSNSSGDGDNGWHAVQCFSEQRGYYSILIVISFFIICINFDVIYTMATNKTLQTKRNAFLLSLSISDLLNGIVSIPLYILCNCYHPGSENLVLAQAICFRFVAISTMLNILMITIERYIGIIYPIRYQFILTKARTSILIICTWATSVSSALVSYSWLISVSAGQDQIPLRERKFERAYFLFSFVAFFLLPLVIMTVLYTKMFRAISKARRLASKAQMYLKNCDRSQSPIPRSPVEIRLTRPRSVTVGCYGDHHYSQTAQTRSLPQSPATRSARIQGRSSFREHPLMCRSPARVDTMVTHSEPRGTTVSPIQSLSPFAAPANHRLVSNQLSWPENCSVRSQSPFLSLPLNEASRYANHHGSHDRFLSSSYRFLNSSQRLKSTSSLSTSTQALHDSPGAKPLKKYQSDGVIASREKSEKCSFAERLSDVCETAASKLRMFRHGSNEDRWGHSRMKREHRVLLVFVTMLLVFVLSWISWYILVLDFTYSIYIPDVVLDCFDILRFSVSFVNPLLYTFLKKDFRLAFKKSLRKFSTDQQKTKSEIKEKLTRKNTTCCLRN